MTVENSPEISVKSRPDTPPPDAQLEPRVQVCPFTVVEELASAVLGIAPAATDSEGVEVEVATDGTSHVGQFAVSAAKLVTVPVPIAIVHAPPSTHDWPFTVVEELARLPFGIAEAAMLSDGVVVEFVTVGVRNDGKEPAVNDVTVPAAGVCHDAVVADVAIIALPDAGVPLMTTPPTATTAAQL